MLILLKYIAKLLKALSSEASPAQIAGGFVLGMIIGLTPIMSIHNLLIVILIIILKVNAGMAILSFLIFSGIAYLADPVFHNFGIWLLEKENLQITWTSMYNNEFWAITKFYNTVVLGSFLIAVALCIPMFPITQLGVVQYRKHIHEKVMKTKAMKWLKGTKLYTIYNTYQRVRG
ncbi:MAG: TIGR03546 family protein [Balneolaceae bacterium]|nr:TIGR03546 family protein [Balneolaceae bacterium]MBO6545330.1 TIGR03546 family protein [Balneolaceae bacterium]MBO6646726.1 TIGR03546 family protein [Balneolaceae bacterium]